MKKRSTSNRRVGGPKDIWPDVEIEARRPTSRRPRTSGPKGPPPVPVGKYALVIILVLVVVTGLWFGYHPDKLASIYYYFKPVQPRVDYLVVEVEGEQKRLKPDETLAVHPQDKLFIRTFKSNLWRNHGLEIESPSLNLGIFEEPKSLMWLLGEDAFIEPKVFTLRIKKGPETVANFYLQSEMHAVDWVGRAKQATEPEKKIYYYQLALNLAPEDPAVAEHLAHFVQEFRGY